MADALNVRIIENASLFFDVLPYITSVVCALIAGLVSWGVAHKQAKNAIRELDEKYKLEFEQYKEQDLYEMRKKVIFKALNLFDDFTSWLTINGQKPVRKKDCLNSKFTFQAREVYNELCVTVNNQKLVFLFYDIFFGDPNYHLKRMSEFRKEARKELGLSEIDLPTDAVFILSVCAADLAEFEEGCNAGN